MESAILNMRVAMNPISCRSTVTYRVLLLVLNPPRHKVPHKSLEAYNLVGRGQGMTEGDIQRHVAGGNSGVRDTKD